MLYFAAIRCHRCCVCAVAKCYSLPFSVNRYGGDLHRSRSPPSWRGGGVIRDPDCSHLSSRTMHWGYICNSWPSALVVPFGTAVRVYLMHDIDSSIVYVRQHRTVSTGEISRRALSKAWLEPLSVIYSAYEYCACHHTNEWTCSRVCFIHYFSTRRA